MVPSLFCCSVIWDILQQLTFAWLPSSTVAPLKFWNLSFCAAAQCGVSHSHSCLQAPALGLSLARHTGVTKVLWVEGNLSFPLPEWSLKVLLHMELLLFLSRGNCSFLESVSSGDAQYLFIVTFGFNVKAALCILWLCRLCLHKASLGVQVCSDIFF